MFDHGNFTFHDRIFYISATLQSTLFYSNTGNRNLPIPSHPEFSFQSSDWVEDPIKLFQGCSSPLRTSMLNTVTSVAVRAHITHTRVVLPCLRTGSMDVQTHRVFLPVFGLGRGSHKTLSGLQQSIMDIHAQYRYKCRRSGTHHTHQSCPTMSPDWINGRPNSPRFPSSLRTGSRIP